MCAVCARVCCHRFATRAGKDKKGAAYFFPRRHEVLVGFEDVRQSFLDVFLLHAGQHSRGQEQRKTPLLPAESRVFQPPYFQMLTVQGPMLVTAKC